MSSQIIVTGGAGFIGSNLVMALQDANPSAEITVIDDFRSGHFKNLEGFKGDVIAAELVSLDFQKYFKGRKIDTVYHLASITDTTDHNQFRQTRDNVESWRNLYAYFRGTRARVVYASSAATYGIAAGINRINQIPKPANVYAFSKVQLDNLARRWAQECPKQVIVGLKYFNVYGPREAHKGTAASMIYQLAQQMKNGQRPKIFKHGEHMRDFVYVDDIVRFTTAAAQAKKSGLYNAGSGEARSFNDVVENLNRVLKTKLAPEYIDNPHQHYQPHTQADMTATINDLKTKPAFSLEKGIEHYYKSGYLV
jgi:ADP-L-glycero-D-manno-heptose 6-epimerase